MPRGNLALVLHAHLPFVREPRYPRFLEENWLFEAMTECYIPMLQFLNRLYDKGIPAVINVSISPPLLHMLQDSLLMQRYETHLQQLLKLAQKEVKRYDAGSMQGETARFYLRKVQSILHGFVQRFHKNLVLEIKSLWDRGMLDVFTCVGTHPYLPAYQTDKGSIHAHLQLAQMQFKNAFGCNSKGVWIPECGYFPGLDALLAQHGYSFFLLETHGVLMASPPPKYGVFQGITTNHGMVAYGRDQASSQEVWSRNFGYPGHPDYREFYHDLQQDVSAEYLGNYFLAGSHKIDTGFKYHRISGSEEKLPYQPYQATKVAKSHAHSFVEARVQTVDRLRPHMDTTPIVVCPYDAELFGHWWYEGPDFLEAVCEEVAAQGDFLRMVGLSELPNCTSSVHQPAFSSWGEGGFGSVWINPENDWIYPMVHSCGQALRELATRGKVSHLQKRILNQMARELALMQSSDWPFMIHNNSASNYASGRVREHYATFQKLQQICNDTHKGSSPKNSAGTLVFLEECEAKNNIFPFMDYRIFCQ